MELDKYIALIYEQINGILSISLADSSGKELLRKLDPRATDSHSLPPPKSSLAEVFLKQCQQTKLLTGENRVSSLDTLVTYFKQLQLLQFSFSLDKGEFLIFTVVAKNTAKTGILIALFRDEFIPGIQKLVKGGETV